MIEEMSATDELKRVDHLIFVTLKYTRTVDIIKNVLQRLVSAMDCEVHEMLDYFRHEGKLKSIPPVALVRCRMLEQFFPKEEGIMEFIEFYHHIRKLVQSDYKKKEEYRKNVALVTQKEEIDIDSLKEYAEKTKKYIYYLKELIGKAR